MKPASAVPASTVPFSLKFRDPTCEKRYVAEHAAKARTHDLQAAATYLTMVASGSLLYMIITATGIRATTVDCCTSLIICSWIGPAAHLALLWLMPPAAYQKHRTMITLCFRVYYLLATSINGFGLCGVGRIGSPALPSKPTPAESPMSAFLWRSGIIGLIWYAGAFPLLFWQHAFVQTGFLVAYWVTLSPLVCSTVQCGSVTLSRLVQTVQVLLAQLLAAIGAPESAAQTLQSALATHGHALDSKNTYSTCMQALGFLQVVVGHALPSFVIYCTEARSRQHWLAVQRQQQQVLLRRTSSGASSNSSSNASNSGSHLRERGCSDVIASLNTKRSGSPLASAAAVADGAGGLTAPAGSLGTVGTAAASSQRGSQHTTLQDAVCHSTSEALGAQRHVSLATCRSHGSHQAPSSVANGPNSALAAAGAVTGVKAAAVKAGKRLVKRTASWRNSRSASGAGEFEQQQLLLLGLSPIDAFEKETLAGHMPPSFPEVYALLLVIGLAWLGLGYAV